MNFPLLSRIIVCSLMVFIGLPWNARAADHYLVTAFPILGTDTTNPVSLQVSLQAIGPEGAPLESDTSTVTLYASTLAGGGVVISEITPDGETIEFTNTGETSVDVGGWALMIRSRFRSPSQLPWMVIPGPAVLAPGETFLWSSTLPSTSTGNGTFPQLKSPPLLLSANRTLIDLRDSSWNLVDQVFVAPAGSQISVSEILWTGPPITLPIGSSRGLVRTGSANHRSSLDWTLADASPGKTNSGLVVPAPGLRTPAIPTPSRVTLANGKWTGTVTIPTAGSRRIVLSADNGTGILSESPLVTLPSDVRPKLSIGGGPIRTREAAPGLVPLTVSIPKPEAVPVELAIWVDAPTEYAAPARLVIPAGATSAALVLTNLDDSVADGTAVAHLTVSASGHQPASLELVNEDNESNGRLQAWVPSGAIRPTVFLENSMLQSERCQVTLFSAATHDVEVLLEGTGRLRVPARVIIPAGATSTSVPFLIQDDSLSNLSSPADEIIARTGAWPASRSGVKVVDDERPDVSMDLPAFLIEGTTGTCTLGFSSPRPADLEITVNSSGSWLLAPEKVVLPAGATNLSFSISTRNSGSFEGDRSEDLTVVVPTVDTPLSATRTVQIRDDEFSPTSFDLVVPPILFTEDENPISLALLGYGFLQRTNAPVSLRFAPPSGARVLPPSDSITLSNGLYSGPIRVGGEALSTTLEISSLGATNHSGPITVLPGRTLNGQYQAVSSWPKHSDLLAIQTGNLDGTGSPALISLNPATGTERHRLPLPAAATQIAVSDSGSTAWLVTPPNTILRVDLTSWTSVGGVEIPLSSRPLAFNDLAVGTGTEDTLAVVVTSTISASARQTRLVGVLNGVNLVDGRIFNLSGGAVCAGAKPGEFQVIHDGALERMILDGSGFSAIASVNIPGFFNDPSLRVTRSGNTLVLGNGELRNADTLELIRSLALPIPTAIPLVFSNGNRLAFQSVDTTTTTTLDGSTDLGTHKLPLGIGEKPTLLSATPWGARGIAFVRSDQRLRIFETPLLPLAPSDLSIALEAPATLRLGTNVPPIDLFDLQYSVRNQGPADAHNVRLLIPGKDPILLNELPAGAEIRGSTTIHPSTVGMFEVQATVISSGEDSNPANNTARTFVHVVPTLDLGETLLELDARDAVTSNDHHQLFVATGPAGGTPGIAVVDADQARVPRTLDVGGPVKRLSLSPDGTRLVALRDDGRVTGWDLTANVATPLLDLGTDQASDIAALPGTIPRTAVAVGNGVRVYEAGSPASFTSFSGRTETHNRSLAYIGTSLWAIDPIAAYELNPGAPGTPVVRKINLSPAQQDTRFWYTPDAIRLPGVSIRLPGGLLDTPAYDQREFADVDQNWFTLLGTTVSQLPLRGATAYRSEAHPSIGTLGPITGAWRVGSDRFAVLGGSGSLLLFRSTTAQEKNAFLRFDLLREGTPKFAEPISWVFQLRNDGPETVEFAPLNLTVSSLDAATLEGVPLKFGSNGAIDLGPIGPGQTRQVRVSGKAGASGKITVNGTLSSAATPTPYAQLFREDSVSYALPVEDLAIQLNAPSRMELGKEYQVECIVTNQGTTAVQSPVLHLFAGSMIQLSTASGQTSYEGALGVTTDTNLPPGGTLSFHFTGKPKFVGVDSIQCSVSGPHAELTPGNNAAEVWIGIASTNGSIAMPNLNLFFDSLQWLPSRRLWLAARRSHLALLEPTHLSIVSQWDVAAAIESIHPTTSGRFAWFTKNQGELARLSLETGAVDQLIRTTPSTSQKEFAPLPNSEDTLAVVDQGPVPSTARIAVYKSGIQLHDTYDKLPWQFQRITLSVSEGRVFAASDPSVIELIPSPSGLNLSKAYEVRGRNVRVEDGLFISPGAFTLDYAATNPASLPAFVSTSDGFGLEQNGTTAVVWDLARRQPVWTTSAPVTNTFASPFLAGGSGILITGQGGGFIPAPTATSPDLSVRAQFETAAPGITNLVRFVRLTLGVAPGRAAQNARLVAQLSPSVRPDSESAPSNPLVIPLGNLSTNTTLRLPFSTVDFGPASIRFRIESDLPDANPADNEALLAWETPELPQLLIPDQSISSLIPGVKVLLTRPAPFPITFHFQVDLGEAWPPAVRNLGYNIRVETGQTETIAAIPVVDSAARTATQFRVSLSDATVPVIKNTAMIQIPANRILTLQMRVAGTFEGDSGFKLARIPVTLDAPISVPLEIALVPRGITATAGTDFDPAPIRLRFAPGQTNNTLDLPVLGDTNYEPDETVTFDVLESFPIPVQILRTEFTIHDNDPAPVPRVRISRMESGDAQLSFETLMGKNYWIETSKEPGGLVWKTFFGPFSGSGTVWSGPVPLDSPTRYFRIRME